MKLNKEQFKEFIISEIKKVATEEGWFEEGEKETCNCNHVHESKDSLNECGCGCSECDNQESSSEEETINTPSEEDFEEVIPENKKKKEEVVSEEKKEEEEADEESTDANPKTAQVLSEELERMKHLLDFRSPLLGEQESN